MKRLQLYYVDVNEIDNSFRTTELAKIWYKAHNYFSSKLMTSKEFEKRLKKLEKAIPAYDPTTSPEYIQIIRESHQKYISFEISSRREFKFSIRWLSFIFTVYPITDYSTLDIYKK